MESPDSPQRPSAMEMANAGFFHTGRADETVCGACFLGLRDWQPCDVDAEAVHARFAAGGGSNGGGCLFLNTRRLLTSVLPLARKHLTSSTPRSDTAVAATVIERLAVIAREMAVGGSGDDKSSIDCWPVENARVLGYSDDLILLALWRLQTEGNAVNHAWEIDPQVSSHVRKLCSMQTCITGEFPALVLQISAILSGVIDWIGSSKHLYLKSILLHTPVFCGHLSLNHCSNIYVIIFAFTLSTAILRGIQIPSYFVH